MLNIVWLPFIWYFYIETAGLSLEEIDRLFVIQYESKGMSWREATRLAKEEIAIAKMQIHEKTQHPIVGLAEHNEFGSSDEKSATPV